MAKKSKKKSVEQSLVNARWSGFAAVCGDGSILTETLNKFRACTKRALAKQDIEDDWNAP